MSLVEPAPEPDPVQVLLTVADPEERSRAHVVLGERALERRDLDTAEVHLREALALAPGVGTRQLAAALDRARTRRRRRWFR